MNRANRANRAHEQEPSPRRDRRGLRLVHGLLAIGSMTLALPIAALGTMALVGTLTDNLWIRAAVSGAVLLLVPLVLADRLLPADPSRRKPGLVRDVFAGSWTAAALAIVGLAGSLTAAPLRAEASRLEDRGWARAAYLGRWIAGPEPKLASEAEAEDGTALALADEPAPAPADEPAAAAAAPEPAPEPEPAAGPEPASVEPSAAAEPTPAEPEPPREYSPAELFASYAPAVVSIKVDHGGWSSGGTGFLIDVEGTIATNEHVIRGASTVRVKLFDGTELTRVELLASDAERDLALLRVDPAQLGEGPRATVLGDSEAVEVGEPVSVIGNPLGLDHTLTNGIVSARRIYEGERFIQMSAPISPGNSGGPVFDRHGRVIGVSVAQMVGGQNLNLAVPVSQLQAMIARDYPERRSFGASSW